MVDAPYLSDPKQMESRMSIHVSNNSRITLNFARTASIFGMKSSMTFKASDVLKFSMSKKAPKANGFRMFGFYIPYFLRIGSFYSFFNKDWEYWDVNYFGKGTYCELYLKNQPYTRVVSKINGLQGVQQLMSMEQSKYWDFGTEQTRKIEKTIITSDHKFSARIVVPRDTTPTTGLLMLPGSGPTDKDWNSPSLSGDNGSGKAIAELLAREGFCSIAFDKIKTTGNSYAGPVAWSTYLEDQRAALAALRKEVSSVEKVFILGHSEGTLHAIRLFEAEQDRQKIDGLILLAPAGRTLQEIIVSQITSQINKIPLISQKKKDVALKAFGQGLESIANGSPLTSRTLGLPFYLKKIYEIFSKQDTLAYSSEIFPYDPKEHLLNVTAPVLLVAARKDQQAVYEEDALALYESVSEHKQADVTLAEMKNSNHVFKFEPKPLKELGILDALSYNKAGKVIDPEVIKTISAWLNDKSSP